MPEDFPFVAAGLESELQRAMGMRGTIGAGAGDLDEYCVRVCVWEGINNVKVDILYLHAIVARASNSNFFD